MKETKIDTGALRVKMALLDLNYKTLSELMECDRNTVANIIKGRFKPSYDIMGKFKTALKLSSEEAGRIFFDEKLA